MFRILIQFIFLAGLFVPVTPVEMMKARVAVEILQGCEVAGTIDVMHGHEHESGNNSEQLIPEHAGELPGGRAGEGE